MTALLRLDAKSIESLDIPKTFLGLKRLNSGMTSVILHGGAGRVWRMTVDEASHKVITNPRLSKAGFLPKCHLNMGKVGMHNGLPVYLGLFERLRPRYRTRKGEELPKLIDKEFDAITDMMYRPDGSMGIAEWNGMVCDVVCAPVWQWAALARSDRWKFACNLTLFFQQLRDAATREKSYLDLHEDNFMYRPGSGALVVADPVISLACLSARNKRS